MAELDVSQQNFLEGLECPVCTNYMSPPIRQCGTGHSLCEPCMQKLPQCPLCQADFINIQNFALETLARQIRFPCIYSSLGCDTKIRLEQRQRHEKNCSFKGFKCAMDNCTWVGKLEHVSQHWISKGKSLHNFNHCCTTKMDIPICHSNLAAAHNKWFWFKHKVENGKAYWAVQLIERVDKPTNYFYEIEIFIPNVSKPTVIFKDYCQSVDIDDCDLFNANVCITINTDCLERFTNKARILFYRMRIHKQSET